jgi:hypothetical protein
MNPRDIVLEQISHHETVSVPYTLAFEQDVYDRLDRHFGGDAWRGKLIPYIKSCGGVGRPPTENIDATHYRDAFGTVWRTDQLPPVVVEPGLKAPSFEGYAFPSADSFLNGDVRAETLKCVAETTDAFTIVDPGLCLWAAWYVRGFEVTLMDCVAEEDFYVELLGRMSCL